jgi:uncharacterized protein (TIGR02996 family)
MTRDERALLYAVLADPADDLPRLVYADYLEHDARPPQPDRAEFVRLQCELADAPRARYGRLDPWAPHRRREAELWGYLPARNGVRSSISDALPEGWAVLLVGDNGRGLTHDYPWAVARRGFVAEVRAPLAVLFGGPCPTCHGVHRPPEATRSGVWSYRCQECKGDPAYRTPGVAGQLFAAHPVTSVVVTDREPVESGYASYWWGWDNMGQPERPHVLPLQLMNIIANGSTSAPDFPTRELALSALSAACVALGRSLAAGWTHRVACDGCSCIMLGAGKSFVRGALGCDLCSGTGTLLLPGLPPLG